MSTLAVFTAHDLSPGEATIESVTKSISTAVQRFYADVNLLRTVKSGSATAEITGKFQGHVQQRACLASLDHMTVLLANYDSPPIAAEHPSASATVSVEMRTRPLSSACRRRLNGVALDGTDGMALDGGGRRLDGIVGGAELQVGSLDSNFDMLMPWVDRNTVLQQVHDTSDFGDYGALFNGTNASDYDLRVWLPRRPISSGACIIDKHCAGPDPSNPIGGQCVGKTCMCPIPWAGPGCKKQLGCSFWEESSGWGETTCVLDANLSESYSDKYVCSCQGVGSLDLVVVQNAVKVKKKAVFFAIRGINFSEMMHYFSWDTFLRYPHVYAVSSK